jgi:hypothetical protein
MPQANHFGPDHRRQAPSALLHRVALLLTLAVGGGALVYNAVSIVNGSGGLMGSNGPSGQPAGRTMVLWNG